MIAIDLEHMAADLARQILIEEERTGVKNLGHMAYSTLATAMTQRRTTNPTLKYQTWGYQAAYRTVGASKKALILAGRFCRPRM